MAKRPTKRRKGQSALGGLSSSVKTKTKSSRPGSNPRRHRVLAIQFFPPRNPTRKVTKPRKPLAISLTRRKVLEVLLFAPKPKTVIRRSRPKTKTRSGPRELIIPLRLQAALVLILIVGGLIGSVLFGLQVIRAEVPPPATTSSIATPPIPLDVQVEPRGMPRSAPKQLRIPVIAVNTGFVELGKQADGSMEVPKEYDVAGWYRYAPTPGQIGPAVIVGHVDNYLGAAVFYRLGQLKPGDEIEVDRSDGVTVKFRVDSLKQFDQSAFPTNEVYGNTDYASLRLITCSGQFSRTSGAYSHNTVVFASLIP